MWASHFAGSKSLTRNKFDYGMDYEINMLISVITAVACDDLGTVSVFMFLVEIVKHRKHYKLPTNCQLQYMYNTLYVQ